MKENIDEVIKMLDGMVTNEISRMKIETSSEMEEGVSRKVSHHGRCHVGSPFASGKLFDLEAPECGE